MILTSQLYRKSSSSRSSYHHSRQVFAPSKHRQPLMEAIMTKFLKFLNTDLNAHQLRDHVTFDPTNQRGLARHVVDLYRHLCKQQIKEKIVFQTSLW